MDTKGLKKLIKEAVREAIQEELKDILLEAVRSPKLTLEGTPIGTNGFGIVNETKTPPVNDLSAKSRSFYAQMMSEFTPGASSISKTTSDTGTYSPRMVDPANGTLPEGNVGLDQIMALMNAK